MKYEKTSVNNSVICGFYCGRVPSALSVRERLVEFPSADQSGGEL